MILVFGELLSTSLLVLLVLPEGGGRSVNSSANSSARQCFGRQVRPRARGNRGRPTTYCVNSGCVQFFACKLRLTRKTSNVNPALAVRTFSCN